MAEITYTGEDYRQTGGMREILRLADALNVADVLAPVRDELTKIALIDQHMGAAVKGGRDAYYRAVSALASGNAPDPADLHAVRTLTPWEHPDASGVLPPVLAGIKTRARSAVHQTAWTLGLGLTDELHARMVKLADGAVAAAGREKLPADATDEAELFRAPTIAAAYARVKQAQAVFWDVHRMGDLLRRVGWLPPLGEIPGPYIAYKHPHKRLTAWEYAPNSLGAPVGAVLVTAEETDNVLASSASQRTALPRPLAFWHAIRVGARPGLYDVRDAGERYLAYVSGRASSSDTDRLRRALSQFSQ